MDLELNFSDTEFFTARSKAGLSIEDAAAVLEVATERISQLDAGLVKPTPQQVLALKGLAWGSIQTPLQSGWIRPQAIAETPAAQLSVGWDRKSELGQFFTPKSIADFMAGLFSPLQGKALLLDAGAGEGVLTSAFWHKWHASRGVERIDGVAFEYDKQVFATLTNNLSDLSHLGSGSFRAEQCDFLEHAAKSICFGSGERFTHAILNPPYRKISSDSVQRSMVRKVGFETVNLYSAFVGLALALLKKGGELVAIVPRSFCNGPYYLGFRKFLLERASISHIHIFEKRNKAFSDDGVLQENVILKIVAGGQQGDVTISCSADQTFEDYASERRPFSDIVVRGDHELFVHIPSLGVGQKKRSIPGLVSISELGVFCSTGPVVDFRMKESLRQDIADSCVPLLYPAHFSSGRLMWPKEKSKKPNAIEVNSQTQGSLWQAGYYTVVRRFSAKEERRRIYAAVAELDSLPFDAVGFENHLNVFHIGKRPIASELAWGLAAFLNSTYVDNEFRSFSGHTQVNASDLRKLKYPARERLLELGKRYAENVGCTQPELDDLVETALI